VGRRGEARPLMRRSPAGWRGFAGLLCIVHIALPDDQRSLRRRAVSGLTMRITR
jgi:hypothetical protein